MQLSLAIGSMAVVLGIAAAGGYAVGEDAVPPAAAPKPTLQKKADERAALEEHQKRKQAYERACNKPLKSATDLELCRAAYKRLNVGS